MMRWLHLWRGVLWPFAQREPAPVRTIERAPASANLRPVRPRDNGAPVRAWRAERNGELQTPHGAMRHVAGRDWIVEYGPRDYAVVRGDIFDCLYRRLNGDRFVKRTDVVLQYFTLPSPARVKTLEGYRKAEPGDWIMQGVNGELWPVKPERAHATYDPVD